MIGIILLDTRFLRLPGDIGNPDTFPFPVVYETVAGAFPLRVVKERGEPLLPAFIEAAKALERRGAVAITTSCGFLALWQEELSSVVKVPLFTSSLIQVPWAYELVGRRGQIGVLTVDRDSFTTDHLKGVGAERIPAVIHGMKPESEFHRIYVGNHSDLDFRRVEREVVMEASILVTKHPDISALVLECTNMAVFRKAVREVVKIPVFDILTLIHYIYSSFK